VNATQTRTGSLAKNSRPTTPDQSAVDLANSVTTKPLTTTTDVAKSPFKVLIVEDNLVNQKVLAKQLQKMGCLIYLANHGGEAIERLMSSRLWRGKEGSGIELDVILMDLEMPVMDGLTCTRRIRQLQLSESLVKHIPVIAVTANAREEQIATTMEAGVVSGISTLLRVNADYTSGRCRVQTISHTRTTSED
jgi:CheY-like chemotaxis protein